MTFPLAELAAQLAPPGPTFGRVVALSGTRVVAATPKGRLLAMAATSLAVGDRVVIRDGLAYLSPTVSNSVSV